MNIQYVVAECRPSTDEDGYADVVINDETYIFTSIEPVESIKEAILLTIDISRINPDHKHIVLHYESLQKLLNGIHGQELNE
ncbi:hypothetical protein [Acinetobacter baumannii]|uniref:hypothetical protein n=1 Tax=Acinetobacter baumannii TaxID=470 RepID=UPI001888CEE0|nr:hypothetical protein [Acinetobacter baumannii]MBF1882353.1 hypothetical protein [Acinetobacter baumannii]